MTTYQEYVAGFRDAGEITLQMNHPKDGEPYRLQFPNGDSYDFRAMVINEERAPWWRFWDRRSTLTLKVVGPASFTAGDE